MEKKTINAKKAVMIGCGFVGSASVFALMQSGLFTEIVLIDADKAKAEGEAMDISHGIPFASPMKIYAGDYDDVADAGIIIVSAGAGQKPGETRLDLLHKNAAIMTSIVESLKPHLDPEAIVIVVSNPCDVLSYLAYKKLGLPSSQVFGSGTVLDTSRLKTAISEDTGIDPRNVHTFVVGEHGDSEVAVWSATSIGGLSILDYSTQCPECNLSHLDELHDKVRDAAYQIIAKKGATNYAVALAVSRIVSAVLNDENSVLTVSTYIESEFGGALSDIYLSLPCVVGSKGVKSILHPSYSQKEQLAIVDSGSQLKEKIAELGL